MLCRLSDVCVGDAGVQHKQGGVSGDAAVEARSAQEEKGAVLDTLAHGESRPARGGRRRSVAGAWTSVSCNDTHFWYSPAERLGMVRVAAQLIVAVGKVEESVREEDACGRPGYRLPHPNLS
jgi:hypothetical protein